jgi:hypothetical protein
MLAKVCSAAVNGVEAYPAEVEVNAGYGDTIAIATNTAPFTFSDTRITNSLQRFYRALYQP